MTGTRPEPTLRSRWRELRDAQRQLDELSREERRAGIRDETPEYLAANQRVNEACEALPWPLRWLPWMGLPT